MWETTVNGRPLHFELFGINNQNFIMRDEETGSWWQQVSGEAIRGPLQGTKLKPVPQDEISFAIWKREQPRGRVLRPDPSVRQYAKADWETRMQTMPVATRTFDDRLAPRELIVGVTINGKSKAYPMRLLDPQSPLMDTVGGVPIVIVVAEDKRSVRAFSRRLDDGQVIELFGRAGVLLDSTSGSQWDFTGTAVRGPWTGRRLQKVEVLRDYWFDWRAYNPGTAIYRAGL